MSGYLDFHRISYGKKRENAISKYIYIYIYIIFYIYMYINIYIYI